MHKKPWQPYRELAQETGTFRLDAPLSGTHGHAFIKLAANDWSMAAADVACLLERNVIANAKAGRALGLNHDNRIVLGLTV